MERRAAEIVLPHRRGLLAAQPGNELRHRGAAAPRRHFHRRAQDRRRIGQLADRLDIRMAGQHLLEQRRARARQADDEDRDILAVRRDIERTDETGIDRTLELGDFGGQLARIVAQAFGALAVAFGIVLERLAKLRAVVQRPRQREMQRGAVALVDGRPFLLLLPYFWSLPAASARRSLHRNPVAHLNSR